jgi:hypothetical protein
MEQIKFGGWRGVLISCICLNCILNKILLAGLINMSILPTGRYYFHQGEMVNFLKLKLRELHTIISGEVARSKTIL